MTDRQLMLQKIGRLVQHSEFLKGEALHRMERIRETIILSQQALDRSRQLTNETKDYLLKTSEKIS